MKGNNCLAEVSRSERRMLLAAEARNRKSGNWGAWEKISFPPGTVGTGAWTRDITTAYRNKVFSVLRREAGAGTVHLAVASLSGERPTWWEMQRIKDDLAGKDATAVEVYPPNAEIVDDADMFHIWVLPQGFPFSIHPSRTA